MNKKLLISWKRREKDIIKLKKKGFWIERNDEKPNEAIVWFKGP